MEKPCIIDYKSRKYEVPVNVSFQVQDNKGRAVGFLVTRYEFDMVEADNTEVDQKTGRIWNRTEYGADMCTITEPGHRYGISGISSRNGARYGSADMKVEGPNKEIVKIEFSKKLEKVMKTAVRKWATEWQQQLKEST